MTTNPSALAATPPELRFHSSLDLARADAIRTTLARVRAGEQPFCRNRTTFGARAVTLDGDTEALEFIGVTEPVARDGDIVRVDGIDLAALAKDPVFLWSHDYEGKRPPIGRIVSTNRETDPTLGRIFTFRVIPALIDGVDHEHLDFVRLIWGYYKERFLNSVSYGWAIREARPMTDEHGYVHGLEHTLTEALEWSGCNVGSDRNSVQRLIQEGKLPERHVARFMGPEFRNQPAYELREVPPADYDWRASRVPAPPPVAPVVEPPTRTVEATPGAPLEIKLTGGETLGASVVDEIRKYLPTLLADVASGRVGAEHSKRTKTRLQEMDRHMEAIGTAVAACRAELAEMLQDRAATEAPETPASTEPASEPAGEDACSAEFDTRLTALEGALARSTDESPQQKLDRVLADLGRRRTPSRVMPEAVTR